MDKPSTSVSSNVWQDLEFWGWCSLSRSNCTHSCRWSVFFYCYFGSVLACLFLLAVPKQEEWVLNPPGHRGCWPAQPICCSPHVLIRNSTLSLNQLQCFLQLNKHVVNRQPIYFSLLWFLTQSRMWWSILNLFPSASAVLCLQPHHVCRLL